MPNHLTIDGKGGQFPCFWLDNSGGKPWSDLASYNFDAIQNAPYPWTGSTSGSYALSDSFPVNAGQQVNAVAILATAHTKPFWDFGFALLVQGTTVVDVLFALRPDGSGVIGDVGLPIVRLAAPSIEVAVDSKTRNAVGIVLNDVNYGPVDSASGNQSTYLSATCAPAAGQYRILFGIFATLNTVNPARPAALIVPFFNVT